MDHLEASPADIWNERREWFEGQVFEHQGLGNHLLGEQACALMMEVQSCYCTGAWIAVVVLAFTVIEAQLSEMMAPEFEGNSTGLLRHLEFGEDYQQLRLRRNRIIHLRNDQPAITVDQQWGSRQELKADAEAAVKQMLAAFFSAAGT